MRIIDELDQGAKNVILDRKPTAHFRREVFEKYADLHLINITLLNKTFQLRLATATMCHVSPEIVSLLVKPANHFTGAKPLRSAMLPSPGPENNGSLASPLSSNKFRQASIRRSNNETLLSCFS